MGVFMFKGNHLIKETEKISIITVCKNAEAMIGNCIRSVQEQTFGDVEHWIIDGASEDRTLEKIKIP